MTIRSTYALTLLALAFFAPFQTALPAQEEVARYRTTLRGIDTPRALAVGPGDRIWVAESGRDRVRVFDPDGTDFVTIGERGHAPGQLLDPRGVCVTDDGRAYVADTGNHRIQAFDAAGEFEFEIGGLGSTNGSFHTPLGLALGEDRLLVCDAGNARVQMFSRAGEWMGELQPELPFVRPIDVTVDGTGRIVVADAGAYSCVTFDDEGHETSRFGDIGYFPGLFSLIAGVETYRDRIYVSDAENHRVQEFSPEGELLHKWGLHAIRPREGRGKLHYPSQLAIAPSGEFSVLCEPFDDRVQIFGRGEEVVEGGDVFRTINTQPSPHYGFRAAASGHWLLIAEPETQELLVFDTQIPEPRLVSKIGGYGRNMGQFHDPDGIHLDGESRSVVVTERTGRRLQTLILRVDPEADVAFDREMASFVRMLDFDRLGRSVAGVELEWTIEPGAVTRDRAGRIFLLDGRNERVHVISPELSPLRSFGGHGEGTGELWGPSDLELSPDEKRLYVVDAFNRRVVVFAPDGRALFSFDGAPGQGFDRPYGIAVAPSGKLFITDTGSHRVFMFDMDGKPTGSFGGEGIQRGEFFKPRGVEIDGRGRVVVIDHGNHRAQLFSQDGEYLDSFGARLYTKPARLPESYDAGDYEE
ncbi:MAG: DNA-binding beta-propeller fold protein YncE [Chlamydiales bacterium]|jgi:DNA-binding beta-propeller fold protein YncE